MSGSGHVVRCYYFGFFPSHEGDNSLSSGQLHETKKTRTNSHKQVAGWAWPAAPAPMLAPELHAGPPSPPPCARTRAGRREPRASASHPQTRTPTAPAVHTAPGRDP